MADTQGFFFPDNTPEQAQLLRQQLFAKQLIDGGQSDQATGAYGGLANAGKMLAGALLSKRLGDKAKDLETTREGSYSKALGNFLSPFDYGGAPNADTGIPDNVNVSPQASAANAGQLGSSMGSRLAATGNTDLQRQVAPQVLAQALQANQPITPYQQAELAQQQRTTDPAYLAQVKALPGPLAQAKPQDVIDQENAQAQLASQRQLTAEQTLKQTPGAPTQGMSPEALRQQLELESAKFKMQQGSDDQVNTSAQAIANYQLPPPSMSRNNPTTRAVMERVMQINPDYRAQNYNQSNATQTAFAKGPQANQVRSLNVGIQHLDVLDKLIDAQKNGDVQAVNQLSNAFQQQFGSAAPTNAKAAAAFVGDEITKAVIGGGGALSDRQKAEINTSAASPEQAKGLIKTYKGLLAGQMNGLRKQYESGTFLKDFDEKLLPETKTQLDGLGGGGNGKTPVDFKDYFGKP